MTTRILRRSRIDWGRIARLAPLVVIAACFGTKVANADIEGTIRWGECPPVQEGFPEVGGQECALLPVPLDYRAPNGRGIQIAISRIKAADPAKRRGVLLLNIGGPGARGLDLPRLATALYPQSVLDSYDLIGFDPRGIGRSAPVSCGLTEDEAFQAFPQLEQGRSFDATAAFARNVAHSCAGAASDKLPFITTANTARDMDRIRVALGETKISYFAYSYGTYLGAVYATLFPARTDRWVLDSAVNPDLLWREQFRAWGVGGTKRFEDFIAYALANRETLHFGSTPEEVKALFFELLSRTDADPITFDGVFVTGPIFRVLHLSFLGNDATIPDIARLWQAVRDGTSESSASSFRGAAPAAGFPEIPPDNSGVSTGAVLCDDVAWPRSIDRYRHELAEDTGRYPMFGPLGSHIWACAFWGNAPVEAPVRPSPNGPAKSILILNTFRDPATPLPGANVMRERFGERARLILVDGGGHAIFGLMDNVCATETVASYLVDGAFPQADGTCPANPPEASALTERSALRRQAIKAIQRQVTPIHR